MSRFIDETSPHAADLMDRFDRNWQFFVSRCVQQLVRGSALPEVLDWAAKYGPIILTESDDEAFATLPFVLMPPVEQARMTRWLAWSIARVLPLPQQQFKPMPLTLPGRNDPCPCGSLKKFKQCCAPVLDNMPQMTVELLAAHLFNALPRTVWKTLPQQRVQAHWVMAAVTYWLDLSNPSVRDPMALAGEYRLKDAQALLEPWADLPAPWPKKHALLYTMLCDIYLTVGKPRKRKALAERMIERGDAAVQSLGWQRVALMAADAGQEAQAREAMTRAIHLAPDDPGTALFEVNMLSHWGQESLSRQRADFHARRFQKMKPTPELIEVVKGLQQIAQTGLSASLLDRATEDSVYGRLAAWLKQLPTPTLALDLSGATAQDMDMLLPDGAAKAALADWAQVFDLEQPTLTDLMAPVSAKMDFAHAWLPVLENRPVLGHCFDVLDGLVLLLQQEADPEVDALVNLLLQRALALWALLRERYPQAACSWAILVNRPALRLLAQSIARDRTVLKERSFELMAHLVNVLNPRDNHGYRETVAAVYLRRQQVPEALALCERYPDDRPGMELLHALALQHAGQSELAIAKLHTGLNKNAHLKRLLKSRLAPAMPPDDWITLGSKEEAQTILHEQFDLWQSSQAKALLQAAGR